MTLLEAAVSYAGRGWQVFPIHSVEDAVCSCGHAGCQRQGKHPRVPHGVAEATTDLEQIRAWWDRWPDANIGVACGPTTGLVILDIDLGHGGEQSLARLVEEHGSLPGTSRVRTGSGGLHIYFAHPDLELKNRVGFVDGLDIRAEGGYVIAPPSSHSSGGSYSWEELDAFHEPPAWLLKLIGQKSARDGDVRGEAIRDGRRNAALASLAGTMRARGMSLDSIVAALRAENTARCDPPLDDGEVVGIAESIARYDPEAGGDEDFQTYQEGAMKGKRIPNQHNIELALSLLEVRLRYDEFADRLLDGDVHLDDSRIAELWLEIERRFKFRAGKDYFWTKVEDLARSNAFHPVREYLDSLTWDGVPRVDDWLSRYAGVEDSTYSRAVGKIFLVAAVRRVRRPGCKFDEMLVMESPQGGLKSTMLAILATKEDWFSDDLPLNAHGKELIEQTRGRWIIEAADLAGMRRSDVDALKATLSRRVDKGRPAYGRLTIEVPRQWVACGTTNDDRYLRDTTGNRRFWPVKIGVVDLDALIRDRDQLWAETAALESAGEAVRLAPALYEDAGVQQEDRRVVTALEELVEEIFDGVEAGRTKSASLHSALGITKYDNTGAVKEAMAAIGWVKKRAKFRDGANVQAFVKVDVNRHGMNGRSQDQDEILVSRDASGQVKRVIDHGGDPPF